MGTHLWREDGGYSVMLKGTYVKKRLMDPGFNIVRRLYIKLLFGSRIGIGKRVKFGTGISFEIGPGGKLNIGDGCVIDRNVNIGCYNGGQIRINEECVMKSGASLQAIDKGIIDIRGKCHIGMNTVISAKSELVIRDGCQIAEMVSIRDHDHKFGKGVELVNAGSDVSEVEIGRNVWIGAKATITKGIEIGENSVIGANAVVTEDIPPDSVAVGIPAKVIKTIEG